jgi:hypothetical protein
MARARKKKRASRLKPDNPAEFKPNGKVNEVEPEQLKASATKKETAGFTNSLDYDVVILLYGPPFVLTVAPGSNEPAGIEISANVRAIPVKAHKPSDTFGTTTHGNRQEITQYRVIVDPNDPNGNIGGLKKKINNRSGQDPEIIISGP